MFDFFTKKHKIAGLMGEGMNRSQNRARIQTYKSYYQGKIKSLEDRKLSPPLLILLCRDAPIEPGLLDTKSRRNAYIKKCLRYFRHQLGFLDNYAKKLKIY
jgi:hypothetical protein